MRRINSATYHDGTLDIFGLEGSKGHQGYILELSCGHRLWIPRWPTGHLYACPTCSARITPHPFTPAPNGCCCSACGRRRSNEIHNWKDEIND
jgi:hypothetical protein